MLSIYIEMLLCVCHLRFSSGGLLISSDSETVRRLFNIAGTAMAKEEENWKAFFALIYLGVMCVEI